MGGWLTWMLDQMKSRYRWTWGPSISGFDSSGGELYASMVTAYNRCPPLLFMMSTYCLIYMPWESCPRVAPPARATREATQPPAVATLLIPPSSSSPLPEGAVRSAWPRCRLLQQVLRRLAMAVPQAGGAAPGHGGGGAPDARIQRPNGPMGNLRCGRLRDALGGSGGQGSIPSHLSLP